MEALYDSDGSIHLVWFITGSGSRFHSEHHDHDWKQTSDILNTFSATTAVESETNSCTPQLQQITGFAVAPRLLFLIDFHEHQAACTAVSVCGCKKATSNGAVTTDDLSSEVLPV